MSHSMTGYGRATASCDGREITIEAKSVNHRFLDLNIRLPRTLSFLEDEIRKKLQSSLSRGHIDVFVNYRNDRPDSREIKLDEALLREYRKAIDKIALLTGAKNDLSAVNLSGMPDVLTVAEGEEDQRAVTDLALEALKGALDGLISMRRAEGAQLNRDLLERTEQIRRIRREIAQIAPGVTEEYRLKLTARIAEILDGVSVDQDRLATEVALYADKSNIDEELVRLASHLDQFDRMLAEDQPVGRKLDFLVQELNREVNTIGSKSSMVELQRRVVTLKSEIEKIREQVQNIE